MEIREKSTRNLPIEKQLFAKSPRRPGAVNCDSSKLDPYITQKATEVSFANEPTSAKPEKFSLTEYYQQVTKTFQAKLLGQKPACKQQPS
jgi:hypothetical protein